MELKTTNSNASKLVKYGKKLRELCSIYNALFIVRSRADIGHILQADGISLEPGDIDINSARHLLGEQSIAGFFVYTKDDMEKALREKADFIVLFSELSDTVLSEYNNFFIPIFKITEINV